MRRAIALLLIACVEPAADAPASDLTGQWGPEPSLTLTQTEDGALSGVMRTTTATGPVAILGLHDASVVRLTRRADGAVLFDGHVPSHFQIIGTVRATEADTPVVLERQSPVPSDVDLSTLVGEYDARVVVAKEGTPYPVGHTSLVSIVIGPDVANPRASGTLTHTYATPATLTLLYARRGRAELEENHIDLTTTPPTLHYGRKRGRGEADISLEAELTRRTP